jgi:ATP-binding cassette subfamily B protein
LDKIIFKEVFSLLKTLSRSIRQYKFMSILTPIFTAGECALEVFLPFVTAKLIDQGIQGGDMNAVWRYVLCGAELLLL